MMTRKQNPFTFTVAAGGVLFGLLTMLTMLTGCGGGGGGSSSPSNSNNSGTTAPGTFTQTINTTGATAQTVTPAQYPSLTMAFSPGSIGGSGSLPLTVQASSPSTAAPQGQGVAPGTTYDFGPTGTTFMAPVQVAITYDPTQLAPGTQRNTLQLETLQNGAWSTSGITNNVVNTTTHTITADIAHFSTFGALVTIINQFAGTYTGTYSGNGPNGTFGGTVDNITVNANGTLTGSADGGAETGSGTVSPTGSASLTTSGSGSVSGTTITFTFTGTFSTTSNGYSSVKGTFHDSVGESGTWTASN